MVNNDCCLREKRKPVPRGYNAPAQRKVEESNIREHKDGNACGQTSEASCSDSLKPSSEIRCENPQEKEEVNMDRAIKSVKKSIDKKMDKLVKQDIRRDKKCDKAEKMAKKKR